MKLLTLALVGISLAAVAPTTRADAGRGLLAGALVGGIIGHQSHETGAGIALGAVAGGLIGGALDRPSYHRERVVVRYDDYGYNGYRHCDDGYYRGGWGHRDHYSTRVVYVEPAPRVVYVEAPPAPVVVVNADDAYGFTSNQYLALLKPEEMEILRQRSYGKPEMELAAFLTEKERANLRARSASQIEIGR